MLPESSMRTIEFGLWHQRVRLALGYPDILCFPMYCLEWRARDLFGQKCSFYLGRRYSNFSHLQEIQMVCCTLNRGVPSLPMQLHDCRTAR